MKSILRTIFIQSIALYVTSLFLPGLVILGGWPTVFVGGLGLALLFFALKPILQIISFPINAITFGLFTWVINGLLLWVLTVLVAKISVYPFSLHRFSLVGMTIPPIHIYSIIPAYIIIAGVISAIAWTITWLMK